MLTIFVRIYLFLKMFPLASFTSYIRQNSLFSPDQKILLAVSGGKDSVLMAHLFSQAGFDFALAHCNFELRSAESKRDENFVRKLAAGLGVPFFCKNFATKVVASENKVSTQMAARELRYEWFETLRTAQGFDYIAVAHHQDDSMETVLLNLVRGTGIAGLHGIRPKRGYIIRPMLFLSRAEINEFIELNQIDFVEDSSNLSHSYARNKIRLNVVPHLKEINSGLATTFLHNIRRFQETEEVLQQRVEVLRRELFQPGENSIGIPLSGVMALTPKLLLLFELLKPYQFTESVTAELIAALGQQQCGTSFYSKSHCLTIDREFLILTALSSKDQTAHQVINAGEGGVQLNGKFITVSYTDRVVFGNDPNRAFVDADKLIFPLSFRSWKVGDRFMPLGMSAFKKLSDFFIDLKIPRPAKSGVLLMINGNGEVIWVVGMRQDNRYKVTSTTKKVAIFEQKLK